MADLASGAPESELLLLEAKKVSDMFAEAAARAVNGNFGQIPNVMRAAASSCGRIGSALDFTQCEDSTGVLSQQAQQLTMACLKAQHQLGPLFHVHLFISDLRSSTRPLPGADSDTSSKSSNQSKPLILFSPTALPVAKAAAVGKQARCRVDTQVVSKRAMGALHCALDLFVKICGRDERVATAAMTPYPSGTEASVATQPPPTELRVRVQQPGSLSGCARVEKLVDGTEAGTERQTRPEKSIVNVVIPSWYPRKNRPITSSKGSSNSTPTANSSPADQLPGSVGTRTAVRIVCLRELASLSTEKKLKVYKEALGIVHRTASQASKSRLGPLKYGFFTAPYMPQGLVQIVLPQAESRNNEQHRVIECFIDGTSRDEKLVPSPVAHPMTVSHRHGAECDVEVVSGAVLAKRRFGACAAVAVLTLLCEKEAGVRAAVDVAMGVAQLSSTTGIIGHKRPNSSKNRDSGRKRANERPQDVAGSDEDQVGPVGQVQPASENLVPEVLTQEGTSATETAGVGAPSNIKLPMMSSSATGGCRICNISDQRTTRQCIVCSGPVHHMCSIALYQKVYNERQIEEWEETAVVCSRACGLALRRGTQ